MKPTAMIWILLGVLIGSGCASLSPEVNKDRKEFRLELKSDPPLARLLADQGTRKWGRVVTPGTLSIVLTKQPGDDFPGEPSWQVETDPAQPWVVTETEDAFIFNTSKLLLVKEGFDPQPFEYEWVIPKDFQHRDPEGKRSGEMSTVRQETVVLQSPARPQSFRKVHITSGSGPMDLYAFNAEGQPGSLVGTTPFTVRLGVAEIRSRKGENKEWKVWDEAETMLWTVSESGTLLLNAFLVCEKYTSEKISNYEVLKLEDAKQTEVDFVLQMTTPSVPQVEFILQVDTLPSGAGVFVLKDDGTLGQKLGNVPAELRIGLAQQLERSSGGTYLHRGWMMWDPSGLFRLQSDDEESGLIFLSGTFFKEGFAPENVVKKVLELVPGKPFIQKQVLNIPLYTPEQAALREARHRQRQEATQKRPAFIWKAPE